MNDGADKVSKLGMKKVLERYILSVALLYGRNPRNGAQAFQEILGDEISEFMEQAKNGSEQNKGSMNTTVILGALGFIPQLKPYRKYMGKIAAVLVGALSFMGAKKAQSDFAEQLVEQVRNSSGDAPDSFSDALETDKAEYQASKAEKAEQKQSRVDKSRERVKNFTEKVHLPRRSSEARGAGKKPKKSSKKQAEA